MNSGDHKLGKHRKMGSCSQGVGTSILWKHILLQKEGNKQGWGKDDQPDKGAKHPLIYGRTMKFQRKKKRTTYSWIKLVFSHGEFYTRCLQWILANSPDQSGSERTTPCPGSAHFLEILENEAERSSQMESTACQNPWETISLEIAA